MHLPKRKRLCYILKSNFTNKPELSLEKWQNFVEQIQNFPFDQVYTSWNSKLESGKIPSNCKIGDELAEKIHQKLDTLPNNGPHEYLLDILWFTDGLPKKIINLYGALKRSVEWHGASLNIISDDFQASKYSKDLRAKIISGETKLMEFLEKIFTGEVL